MRSHQDLERRVAARTRWLSLMHSVAQAINEVTTWDDALSRVLRRVCEAEQWQIVAPLVFALLSMPFFRRYPAASPLRTSLGFVGIVVALDAFVVAPLSERSYAMFTEIAEPALPDVFQHAEGDERVEAACCTPVVVLDERHAVCQLLTRCPLASVRDLFVRDVVGGDGDAQTRYPTQSDAVQLPSLLSRWRFPPGIDRCPRDWPAGSCCPGSSSRSLACLPAHDGKHACERGHRAY
jgi:hypothetical protein